jgi:hypothetical protein
MKLVRIALVALTLMALAACGSAPASSVAEPMPAEAVRAESGGAAPPSAPAMDVGAPGEVPAAPQQSGNGQIPSTRLVIRNAELSMYVEDVRAAEAAVRAKATALGGFVVSAETSGDASYLTARVVIRVPAAAFDDALNGVQGLAERVLSRTVSGQDVTEEYVDLESRLRTLEATSARLMDLLARAETVEEALSVNMALTDVQGQVEQVKGRMQYLEQSAAMSTIAVSMQPVPVTPLVDEDSWQPIRVAREALRDLLEFGEGLVNLAIVLLIWLPVWLPLVLAGRWGMRRLIRRAKQPIAPPTTPTDPTQPVA